jgi:hypothetical protein
MMVIADALPSPVREVMLSRMGNGRHVVSGLAAVGGAALTVAFSFAPFMSASRGWAVSAGGEWYLADNTPMSWSVWSPLAFTGPMRSAVALSAIVAALTALRLLGSRLPWLYGFTVFGAISSAAIIAGYLLSAKQLLLLESDGGLPGPVNGWGGYAMFGAALVTVNAVLWSGQPLGGPSRPGLPADLLVFGGAVLVAVGSLNPFLVRPPFAYTNDEQFERLDVGMWGWHTFIAPLTWTVVAAAGLAVGLRGWHRLRPSSALAWSQLYVSAYASVVIVGYAVSEKHMWFGLDPDDVVDASQQYLLFTFGPFYQLSFGIGGWLMLAGCLVMMAGGLAGLPVARQPATRPLPEPPLPAQAAGPALEAVAFEAMTSDARALETKSDHGSAAAG